MQAYVIVYTCTYMYVCTDTQGDAHTQIHEHSNEDAPWAGEQLHLYMRKWKQIREEETKVVRLKVWTPQR